MRTIVTAELPAGSFDALHDAGHDVVQVDEGRGLGDVIGSADALICLLTDRVDRVLLEAGARGRLRVVANVGAGHDNIDVRTAQTLGIAVTNTSCPCTSRSPTTPTTSSTPAAWHR